MSNWSALPVDLLGLILRKLALPDYIRFGGVCVSWHLAVKSKPYRPKPQPPWLMIPNDGDDETSARFFSLSEKTTYKILLPQPRIRRRLCVGSSHGWLITVDEISEMHLLNPVTGVQVPLPSITTLPFVDAVRDPQGNLTGYALTNDLTVFGRNIGTEREPLEFDFEETRCFFFRKAVLSSDPSSGDFVVMLIHNPGLRLVFTRAGDPVWTPLRSPCFFKDIIVRGNSFYTLSFTTVSLKSYVHCWDIADGFTDIQRHNAQPSIWDEWSFTPTTISVGDYNSHYLLYLINSLDNRLLMLHRKHNGSYYTDDCVILSMNSETRKWSSVKDVKDAVLFVGNNHSISVSAAEFPELRQKSVYFTDDNIGYSCDLRHERRDIGIFDMVDQCVKPLDSLPPHLTWPPPVWITPALF